MSELGAFEILLVDDHPSDAKLFEHAMKQAGTRAKVYWVASAEEGLDFLRQDGRFQGVGRPKLVVSDLNMPGMDGFEFLRRMRGNPALAAVPVVIFSSSRATHDILRCYQLGANSFIAKSMSLEGFVDTIGALVRYWLDIVELPEPSMFD